MEEELLPLSECWYYSFTSSDYGIGFTYLSSVKEFIDFLRYERRELINDEINDKDGIEEHIEENWRDQYSFDDGITDFKNALKKLSEDLSNLELNEKDLEDVMWSLKVLWVHNRKRY